MAGRIFESLKPKLDSAVGMTSNGANQSFSKSDYRTPINSSVLPVEHDPLGYADDAVLGLRQSGELCEDGVIRICHVGR